MPVGGSLTNNSSSLCRRRVTDEGAEPETDDVVPFADINGLADDECCILVAADDVGIDDELDGRAFGSCLSKFIVLLLSFLSFTK